MSSIPLHCSICPKEPGFSDVSHLLTHVSSKGHLSHQFKAQVNARQSADVRQKLALYDQWYAKYQIEKLLSQRMNAKQARTINDRQNRPKKQASSVSPKARKAAGRQTRKKIPLNAHHESDGSPETKDIIDPQLSKGSRSATAIPTAPTLPEHVSTSHDYTPTPWMQDLARAAREGGHIIESSPDHSNPRQLEALKQWKGTSDDYMTTLLKSSPKNFYPELPEPWPEAPRTPPQYAVGLEEQDDLINRSPLLKGVKYPGMSLFDAASREAQRLRNQKKHGSIVEQMELDSEAIEPMEHIFWPEGTLKKTRLITGNVESSPLKEPTPLPKRPRLNRRNKAARTNFGAPRAPGKQHARPRGRNTGSESPLQNMANRALRTLRRAYSGDSHDGLLPMLDSEDDDFSISNSSRTNQRKRRFNIYQDVSNNVGNRLYDRDDMVNAVNHSATNTSLRDLGYGFPSHSSKKGASPRGDSCPGPKGPQARPAVDNKENIPPLSGQPNFDGTKATFPEVPRVTQRYFSVFGNHPPQFFNRMPPQMEFGGMNGPMFHATYYNPLNGLRYGNYQQPHFEHAKTSGEGGQKAALQE